METVADIHLEQGMPRRALENRRKALSLREEARGTEKGELVSPLVMLGDAQRAVDKPEDAQRSYERALQIAEAVRGPADLAVVQPLTGLAEVRLELGDSSGSLRHAQRATRVAAERTAGPRPMGRARFAFARALRATGEGPDQVR
ncbi:MAG: tetratricopeptide repeat protein, partial [Actinomycetota bacterium]